MKKATAIVPLEMNAANRVNKPKAIRNPPMRQIQPQS